MITHADAAAAQLRAQQLVEAADAARQRAEGNVTSIFSQGYAEGKRREALAAVNTAHAQAMWARWGFREYAK